MPPSSQTATTVVAPCYLFPCSQTTNHWTLFWIHANAPFVRCNRTSHFLYGIFPFVMKKWSVEWKVSASFFSKYQTALGMIQVLFGFQCLTKAISTLSVENFVHILHIKRIKEFNLKPENVYRLQDIHCKHTVSKELAYNTNEYCS